MKYAEFYSIVSQPYDRYLLFLTNDTKGNDIRDKEYK